MLKDNRASFHDFLVHRHARLVRLRRVNQALRRWEEYHAAVAMPAELRPPVFEPLQLSWASCKELQQMLCEELGALEEAWAEHTRAWRN
jgi:hypothetical protein